MRRNSRVSLSQLRGGNEKRAESSLAAASRIRHARPPHTRARARFASHASAALTLDCARHTLDAIRETIVSPHRFKRCGLSQEPKLDFFLGTSRLFGRESWGLVLAAAMGLPVKSLEPLGIRGDYGFPSPLSPPVSRLSTRERKKEGKKLRSLEQMAKEALVAEAGCSDCAAAAAEAVTAVVALCGDIDDIQVGHS